MFVPGNPKHQNTCVLPIIEGECSFASPISRCISHLEFFWVSGLLHLSFADAQKVHQTNSNPGPHDQQANTLTIRLLTAAAEAMEKLWYLCTVVGPDNDPNSRGRGQLPNPKSTILR